MKKLNPCFILVLSLILCFACADRASVDDDDDCDPGQEDCDDDNVNDDDDTDWTDVYSYDDCVEAYEWLNDICYCGDGGNLETWCANEEFYQDNSGCVPYAYVMAGNDCEKWAEEFCYCVVPYEFDGFNPDNCISQRLSDFC